MSLVWLELSAGLSRCQLPLFEWKKFLMLIDVNLRKKTHVGLIHVGLIQVVHVLNNNNKISVLIQIEVVGALKWQLYRGLVQFMSRPLLSWVLIRYLPQYKPFYGRWLRSAKRTFIQRRSAVCGNNEGFVWLIGAEYGASIVLPATAEWDAAGCHYRQYRLYRERRL